jgi:biotin synthase
LSIANYFQNAPLDELTREAAQKRKTAFADGVELDAIINIKSGHCPMDCRFCAQSGRYQTAAPVFPLLNKSELLEKTTSAWDAGIHRVGWVASGCSLDDENIDVLCEVAGELPLTLPQAAGANSLCASLGQLGKNSLQKLKDAGFTRFHHNLETSERFYPEICTTQRWRDRYETVRRVKECGLETCSGVLFGMGETWEDRISIAETLRDLEVDSIPVNFLNPIVGTPLEHHRRLPAEEGLRIIAMVRLICEKATVRVCGGRQTTLQDRQPEMFGAGANAMMTGDFLTTAGSAYQDDLTLISNAGLKPQRAELTL